MLDEREKPPLGDGGLSELPLHDGAGNSEIKPLRENRQVLYQAPAGIAAMRMERRL
jgi:hypothetical protein